MVTAKNVEDFNFDWKFTLEKQQAAHQALSKESFDDTHWQAVRLPHDWAVALPYDKDAAASTGFKMGGIGWYRKNFILDKADINKQIWLEFDGIYNNSAVWINGHYVGGRPYGYASFQTDLTPYLHFDGSENLVAVKVDRTTYADSRWYTGSGIYRNVRLVKAEAVYVPQWGIQVTTPEVTAEQATISVKTEVLAKKYQGEDAKLKIEIFDASGKEVAQEKTSFDLQHQNTLVQVLELSDPQLWSLTSPTLYTAKVTVYVDGDKIETDSTTFGIRSIKFDSHKGFFLNGKNTKIKGVNIHHDAGAVGAAVPKSVWRSRLLRLKSIGVNALRLSHNPHSPELMALADELGFLVNSEAFDDWDRDKKKSKVYLGDNAATAESSVSYNIHFNEWAERDLKDLIRRDFNHPSVIMWSIGNEVEWTYPYYAKSAIFKNKGDTYFSNAPDFTPEPIQQKLKELNPDSVDNLPIIANTLAKYVKEIDTSRPVTAGLVHPSVGFTSGYTDALDIVGFNYRAPSYEAAHKMYPDKVIYGSENWGAWREWRDVKDKDYVSGIFIWTGFAYKGEAGPMPRMGLEISLFDFIGNKTARGHFFETLWGEAPKTYVGTTAAEKSEFSYSKELGWSWEKREAPSYIWKELRRWEWYDINEIWKYQAGEQVVVQSYTNTDSVELFINGKSFGRQQLTDFEDRVVKWLVPYQAGELKVVGYNQGVAVSEDIISTHGELASISLTSEVTQINADSYDTTYVHAQLLDAAGNLLVDSDAKVEFKVTGPAERVVVDNGWEMSIQDVLADQVNSYKGKSAVLIRSTGQTGQITVTATAGNKVIAKTVINAK
ncbi:MAG: sugar-binding domain-containing protein [Thalassotalea sp.]